MRHLYAPFVEERGAVGLLLLRLVFGAALVLHGFPKIQHPTNWMGAGAPVPGFFQFLAAFSEFFGGLAVIIGLLTPIAAFGIAATADADCRLRDCRDNAGCAGYSPFQARRPVCESAQRVV